MKKLSSAEVSSLLNRGANHQEQTEQAQPAGMTLDQYYIALATAVNKDLEAGLINSEMHEARRNELRRQYRALKGQQ
jgi:hypothetical protein